RAAIRWPLSTPLPGVESLLTIQELLVIWHEMSAADGPLPVGDVAGLAVVGIGTLGIGVVWAANQVFYDPATMPEGESGLVPYPVITPEGKGSLIPYPVMTPMEGNAIPSSLVPPQTGENLLPNPLIPPQAIPNQGIGGTLNPNIYMQKGGCGGESNSKLPNQGTVKGDVENAPSVDVGKQGKHVPGHPNYKEGNSAWKPGNNGVHDTQEGWLNGTELPDGTKVWDAGKTTGTNGETGVRVHIDKKGNIHGYPVNPGRYLTNQ
ncbi:MAG: hypothetical protein Q4A19_01305, partial [Johnsonella sp.]|nr:hypothetical protein [Johnsonella sp.]